MTDLVHAFGPAILVQANTTLTNTQNVAALAGGGFVVTYTNSDSLTWAEAYDASHTRIGPAFNLNAPSGVRIAALTDGSFAATWQTSNLQSGSGADIVAQRFTIDAAGNITAGALQVVSDAPGLQLLPSITASGNGFMVGFTDIQSGSSAQVHAPDGSVTVLNNDGDFYTWNSLGGGRTAQ